ncbi:hypothetical protein AB9P05_11430 [Roseivirga sp. BDSF3-8]|uniref:hypothetical protein n=1 Tax=Roseivirga sp. BDSF3-8 TaxID=3241598 RepID=UPI0035319EBF
MARAVRKGGCWSPVESIAGFLRWQIKDRMIRLTLIILIITLGCSEKISQLSFERENRLTFVTEGYAKYTMGVIYQKSELSISKNKTFALDEYQCYTQKECQDENNNSKPLTSKGIWKIHQDTLILVFSKSGTIQLRDMKFLIGRRSISYVPHTIEALTPYKLAKWEKR